MTICPETHCLCKTVQNESARTWIDLTDAETFHCPVHEETITQNFVLSLFRNHPSDIHIHVYDKKREEPKTGADFVWLVFEERRGLYYSLYVQAKRLTKSGKYSAFKNAQVSKLIGFAKRKKGIPIYLTYNHIEWLRFASGWRTRNISRISPYSYNLESDIGLYMIHARHLQSVGDGQLSVRDVAANGLPMWQPFCRCWHTFPALDQIANGELLSAFLNRLDLKSEGFEDDLEPLPSDDILAAWMSDEEFSLDRRGQLNERLLAFDSNAEGENGFDPLFVIATRIDAYS